MALIVPAGYGQWMSRLRGGTLGDRVGELEPARRCPSCSGILGVQVGLEMCMGYDVACLGMMLPGTGTGLVGLA